MKKYILLLILATTALVSCEEELNLTDPSTLGVDQFVTDVVSAETAMNGLYDAVQSTYVAAAYPIMLGGLYSDNFDHTGSFPTFTEFNVNNILVTNVNLRNLYSNHYEVIVRATNFLRTLETVEADAMTAEEKSNYTAEARAIRAFAYAKLVHWFGGIPIIEKTVALDGIEANDVARSSEGEVYNYVMSELNAVEGKLADNGLFRFSNDAVTALKAKVLFNQNNYGAAKVELSKLIGKYSLLPNYSDVFVNGNNPEAIMRINYTVDDSTSLAFWFFFSDDGGRREVAPSQDLLDAFEAGDVRKDLIEGNDNISTAFLNKYTDVATGTDQPYVFRYADILLMYAEVLARENDSNASTYINAVRTRAGLSDVNLNSGNVVDLIQQERRVELYGEGDRWNDIKRLGITQQVIEGKGLTYNPNFDLWPIPQDELDANALINQEDQNPGY